MPVMRAGRSEPGEVRAGAEPAASGIATVMIRAAESVAPAVVAYTQMRITCLPNFITFWDDKW
ncbi:hypothetical protein GCM10022226_78560 [Sphaerisporangium flaviroseum]|uniref:Uncharacterized protein n=1 Tax=Sphaerisporangium flaviroseum TaxID=509199 RepID=A0ABP7JGD4_9ACTN